MTDPIQEKVAAFFDFVRTTQGVILNEDQLAGLYNYWAARPLEDNNAPNIDLTGDQLANYLNFHEENERATNILNEQTGNMDARTLSQIFTESQAQVGVDFDFNSPIIQDYIRERHKSAEEVREIYNRMVQLKSEFLSQIGTNMTRKQFTEVFAQLMIDINAQIHLDLTPEQEAIKAQFEAGFLDKLEDADKSISENQS